MEDRRVATQYLYLYYYDHIKAINYYDHIKAYQLRSTSMKFKLYISRNNSPNEAYVENSYRRPSMFLFLLP